MLCRGPRRVSRILRVMGLGSIRNFSKYHACIKPSSVGRFIIGSWSILIAVDETLERRKGEKFKAKGLYRDAVR
jgi:hypothetical protein